MARKINHDQTSMWARCLGCPKTFEVFGRTDVLNLRRRLKNHADRTGHEIMFQEKHYVEGRIK